MRGRGKCEGKRGGERESEGREEGKERGKSEGWWGKGGGRAKGHVVHEKKYIIKATLLKRNMCSRLNGEKGKRNSVCIR